MKLLVDECFSEELTKLAQRRGHAEASHVAWIGKRGWKDWELKSVIVGGDTPFSAIFIETEMTASACMRMQNRKWGQ